MNTKEHDVDTHEEGTQPVIVMNDVTLGSSRNPVFKNLSLTVEKGEFILVVGRSGSGRSELLKLAAGLYNPAAGSVLLKGYDTSKSKKRDLMRLKSKNGFVFEDDALFSTMSVYDNLALHPKYNTDLPDDEIEDIIRPFAEKFSIDLAEAKAIMPEDLHSKERRMINFLRATMHQPEILFIDSLFDGLEQAASAFLRDEIRMLYNEGAITVIATTSHIVNYEAFVTRVIVLERPFVYFDGTLEEFRMKAEGDTLLREFF